MKLFQTLGDEIEQAWNADDYDEDKFPAIAAEALKRAALPEKLSAWDIIEWTLARPMLPDQKDLHGNFGDPPITLFTAPRFYIDVYFWFEGTTAIHQHGFCGAFQVLAGSSIHSWYDFEPRDAINAYAEIGEMSLKVCELLNVGDVQTIQPGRQYIHSLFHLDQPSVTIVVRTYKIDKYAPQFAYEKPSLAIDPFYEVPVTVRKLQSVSALIRADHPDADRMITDLLKRSDLQTTFQILTRLRAHFGSNQLGLMFGVDETDSRFGRFLEAARERHGDRLNAIEEVIERNLWMNDIVRRRRFVTDPEHRFFFALLMNVEGRERIVELVKQRYPDGDPVGKVADWVYDLANIRLAGPRSQNALGIEDFDETDLFIFEKLLAGEPPDSIRSAVDAEFSAEKAAAVLGTLDERIAKVRDAVVLRPIFQFEQPASRATLAFKHPFN